MLDPVSSIISLVTTTVSRLWPDKSEAGRVQAEIIKKQLAAELQKELAQTELLKGQLEINKIEAANPSVYVSAWRPFIGWVCGLAFAWQYFLCPILTFLLVVSGHPIPQLPVLGIEVMMPVLMGMLGLGGLRTYEKYKGVS